MLKYLRVTSYTNKLLSKICSILPVKMYSQCNRKMCKVLVFICLRVDKILMRTEYIIVHVWVFCW